MNAPATALDAAEKQLRELPATRDAAFETWLAATSTIALPPRAGQYPLDAANPLANLVPGGKPAKVAGGQLKNVPGDAVEFDGDTVLGLDGISGVTRHDSLTISLRVFSPDAKDRAVILHSGPEMYSQAADASGFELLWNQSVEQYGAVIGTDDPDLSRFRDRGGKVIITHGLADQLITAAGSIDYYKRVIERMGGREKVEGFARLFLAPGVDHGFRGAGGTPVGQMEAILRWVEEGTPPDRLTAEHRDPTGKLIRTRPLFPYPQVARYKGSGSPDDAENFASSAPAD